jgi:hypothetical protein
MEDPAGTFFPFICRRKIEEVSLVRHERHQLFCEKPDHNHSFAFQSSRASCPSLSVMMRTLKSHNAAPSFSSLACEVSLPG